MTPPRNLCAVRLVGGDAGVHTVGGAVHGRVVAVAQAFPLALRLLLLLLEHLIGQRRGEQEVWWSVRELRIVQDVEEP